MIILHLLNSFKNKYYLKNINFFRDQYSGISDQEIHNKIDSFHSNIFNKGRRLGGQIFIENSLRNPTWEYYVFDSIFKHFYHENNFKYHDEDTEKLFKI